jgi:hypothetical protein
MLTTNDNNDDDNDEGGGKAMMLDCQYNADGYPISYGKVDTVGGDKNNDIDDLEDDIYNR